jgi:hypothetical protein
VTNANGLTSRDSVPKVARPSLMAVGDAVQPGEPCLDRMLDVYDRELWNHDAATSRPTGKVTWYPISAFVKSEYVQFEWRNRICESFAKLNLVRVRLAS